jgi:WD40 repeat protein
VEFHPSGEFLATAFNAGLTLWPLAQPFPIVLQHEEGNVESVLFEPNGRWLASAGDAGAVRLWPLEGEVPKEGRALYEEGFGLCSLAATPDSSALMVGSGNQTAVVIPVAGGQRMVLEGFGQASGVAVSKDGRLAAAAGWEREGIQSGALYVWEVGQWNSPQVFVFDGMISGKEPRFLSDNRILVSGTEGLWLLNPATGDRELVDERMAGRFSVSQDDRWVGLVEWSEFSYDSTGRVILLDLQADVATPLKHHGNEVYDVMVDPAGEFVMTADKNGVIRVGPITGEEPHLLLGHDGRVWSVAIDPLGRWIASGGDDGSVRLWPMPDLSKPPLHTLPREELIAKLKTLTNLRVVRDQESATGWTLTHDPFPGWETVPTW